MFTPKDFEENNTIKYTIVIGQRGYGKIESMKQDISEIVLKSIMEERRKKEEKINKYVYRFIKSNYNWYDIKMAFRTIDTFNEFIKDVKEKILQDEEYYNLWALKKFVTKGYFVKDVII